MPIHPSEIKPLRISNGATTFGEQLSSQQYKNNNNERITRGIQSSSRDLTNFGVKKQKASAPQRKKK